MTHVFPTPSVMIDLSPSRSDFIVETTFVYRERTHVSTQKSHIRHLIGSQTFPQRSGSLLYLGIEDIAKYCRSLEF
jgi:hypothetical protein